LLNQWGIKNCQFLLAGRGVDQADELQQICRNFDLNNVELLPAFDNTELFYSQLDLFVLSSAFGEAFPNVVAEAMAYHLPCVVTDVGDSRFIVGDTGIVVPPQDPQALAFAIKKILDLSEEERSDLGEKARVRVFENYTQEKTVAAFCHCYEGLG
jgi:glycosyltransferase involved in cell wall biosynthesis